MPDDVLSIIVSTLRDLSHTAAFLIGAVVSYLTLQQPKVKQWLAGAGALVRIAIFAALAVLLYLPLSYAVSDLFAFPTGLINEESGFYASARCLGGVVILAALAAGVVLLVKQAKEGDTEEE